MKRLLVLGVLILLLLGLTFSTINAATSNQVTITRTPEYQQGSVYVVVPFDIGYTQSYICAKYGDTYCMCSDSIQDRSSGELSINGKIYTYVAQIEIKERGGDER